jgi:hypothetical protein
MKNIIKKVLCFFKHDWEYDQHVGMQCQPKRRICLRCGRIENHYGSNSSNIWLWYISSDWRTPEEQLKRIEKINVRHKKAQEIINSKL